MVKLTKSELLGLTAAILLTVPLPAAPAASESRLASVTSLRNQDEQFIKIQANDYAKAYAAGDARTMANMWAPDGTFTDSAGREYKGRAAIEQFFASGFKQYGAQPLEISVESIRFPASGVAIEKGSSRLLQGRDSANISRYTVVHVKDGGKWQMAQVTETDAPQPSSDRLKDLGWLVGNWSASSPKGAVHFKAAWAANHNFIKCESGRDGAQAEDMQIIGWDPATEQIASWHFDSQGGFGQGKWLKSGQSWIEQTSSTEPSGTVSSGVYVFKVLDDNRFAWHSTGRSLGGHNLPDTQELIVTRDQSAK